MEEGKIEDDVLCVEVRRVDDAAPRWKVLASGRLVGGGFAVVGRLLVGSMGQSIVDGGRLLLLRNEIRSRHKTGGRFWLRESLAKTGKTGKAGKGRQTGRQTDS